MNFSVNTTDAVHVYSDLRHIWLQLRRSIPTHDNINVPSFKTAVNLTPAQALAIAAELLTAAQQHQNISLPTQRNKITANNSANHGKQWTADEDKKLVEAFDAQTSIPQLAKAHQRGIGGIQSRLIKLGKLTTGQFQIFPLESV